MSRETSSSASASPPISTSPRTIKEKDSQARNEDARRDQFSFNATPVIQQPDLLPFKPVIQSSYLVNNLLSRIELDGKSILGGKDDSSTTIDPSLRALELAFFGQSYRQHHICQQGSFWYGKALTKLASDLSDPKRMWSLSVLCATIRLTLYEVRLLHVHSHLIDCMKLGKCSAHGARF